MRRLKFGMKRAHNMEYYRVMEIPYEQQQSHLALADSSDEGNSEESPTEYAHETKSDADKPSQRTDIQEETLPF